MKFYQIEFRNANKFRLRSNYNFPKPFFVLLLLFSMEIDFSIRKRGQKNRRADGCGFEWRKIKENFFLSHLMGEKFENKLKNVKRINEKCCQSRFFAAEEKERSTTHTRKLSMCEGKINWVIKFFPTEPSFSLSEELMAHSRNDTSERASATVGNNNKKI